MQCAVRGAARNFDVRRGRGFRGVVDTLRGATAADLRFAARARRVPGVGGMTVRARARMKRRCASLERCGRTEFHRCIIQGSSCSRRRRKEGVWLGEAHGLLLDGWGGFGRDEDGRAAVGGRRTRS